MLSLCWLWLQAVCVGEGQGYSRKKYLGGGGGGGGGERQQASPTVASVITSLGKHVFSEEFIQGNNAIG